MGKKGQRDLDGDAILTCPGGKTIDQGEIVLAKRQDIGIERQFFGIRPVGKQIIFTKAQETVAAPIFDQLLQRLYIVYTLEPLFVETI